MVGVLTFTLIPDGLVSLLTIEPCADGSFEPPIEPVSQRTSKVSPTPAANARATSAAHRPVLLFGGADGGG